MPDKPCNYQLKILFLKRLYFLFYLLLSYCLKFLMKFTQLISVGRIEDQEKVGMTIVSKFSICPSCVWGKGKDNGRSHTSLSIIAPVPGDGGRPSDINSGSPTWRMVGGFQGFILTPLQSTSLETVAQSLHFQLVLHRILRASQV